MITDIFGGSVNNEFMQRLQKGNIWLISGMNLPLVVQMAMLDDEDSIRGKIEEVLDSVNDMICFCNPMIEEISRVKEEF